MLTGVPSYAVRDVWPSVLPYIARVLEETGEFRLGPDDILGSLERADSQLWVYGKPLELVVITELLRHPKALECSVGPIAGRLGEGWESGLALIEEWARAQGCTHIGTLGRPGWKRKLGWQNHYSYHVKEL